MRKATKTIISFAVVLIAGLNLIVPAFAQDPFTAVAVGGISGASGAGLFSSMAGMSGVDIGWNANTADQIDAMWNVTNPDHVFFSGEKHEATNIGDDVYDYITVDIGDWLEAQSDFIANFVSTHNITDNSSGSINGVREYRGIPLDITQGNGYRSLVLGSAQVQAETGASFQLVYDEFKIVGEFTSSYKINYRFYVNDELVKSNNQVTSSGGFFTFHFYTVNGNVYFGVRHDDILYTSNVIDSLDTPDAVDWESETVNTSVFDGWNSAKVKIPSSISQLQTGWTLPDFLDELDRIWYGAGEDNIIIEEGGSSPVPPVPVPDTPLGQVPFDDWVDLWGQGIYQQLENQSDALDFIGSNGEDAVEELESIDTSLQNLEETAESIDTNIGIGNGILGGIRSLVDSAVDYLEGIAENVGELVEEIVEGTETLIAGILNQIPQVFGVIFGPIKQASSIWHYVVEWIQSIGAPFQFIWSMASGTSYYIILPVYASLAAAVVLAFYKRFGK